MDWMSLFLHLNHFKMLRKQRPITKNFITHVSETGQLFNEIHIRRLDITFQPLAVSSTIREWSNTFESDRSKKNPSQTMNIYLLLMVNRQIVLRSPAHQHSSIPRRFDFLRTEPDSDRLCIAVDQILHLIGLRDSRK